MIRAERVTLELEALTAPAVAPEGARFETREAWLQALTDRLRPAFAAAGAPIPERVHVSVGWPGGASARAIGQCWSGVVSQDGRPHVFVSPILERDGADHVLVHELVHAAVGVEHGHKGPFARVARALGLVGKLTATTAGDALRATLEAHAAALGPYPHAPINVARVGGRLRPAPVPPKGEPEGEGEGEPRVTSGPKAQRNRQRLAVCPCGRKLRASRAVLEAGPITCGLCGEAFAPEEGE